MLPLLLLALVWLPTSVVHATAPQFLPDIVAIAEAQAEAAATAAARAKASAEAAEAIYEELDFDAMLDAAAEASDAAQDAAYEIGEAIASAQAYAEAVAEACATAVAQARSRADAAAEAAARAEAAVDALASACATAGANAAASVEACADAAAYGAAAIDAVVEVAAAAMAAANAHAEACARALADVEAHAEAVARALSRAEARALAQVQVAAHARAEARVQVEAIARAHAAAEAYAASIAEVRARAEARAADSQRAFDQAEDRAELVREKVLQDVPCGFVVAEVDGTIDAAVTAVAEASAVASASAEACALAYASATARAEAAAAASARAEAQAVATANAYAEAVAMAEAVGEAKAEASAVAQAAAQAISEAKASAVAQATACARAYARAQATAAAFAEAVAGAKAGAEAEASALAQACAEATGIARAMAQAVGEAYARAEAEAEASAEACAQASAVAEAMAEALARAEASAWASAEASASAYAEAEARASEAYDIIWEAVELVRSYAEAAARAAARASAEAQACAQAAASAHAEATASAEAAGTGEAYASAYAASEAQASSEAIAHASACAQAAAEAHAAAQAAASALAEAQATASATLEAVAEAVGRAQAEARACVAARAEAEAEVAVGTQALAEVRADTDAHAHAAAEAAVTAYAEAIASAEASAQAQAEAFAHAHAAARAEASAEVAVATYVEAAASAYAEAVAAASAAASAEVRVLAEAYAMAQAIASAEAYAYASAQACALATASAEASVRALAEVYARAAAFAEANTEALAQAHVMARAAADAAASAWTSVNIVTDIETSVEAFIDETCLQDLCEPYTCPPPLTLQWDCCVDWMAELGVVYRTTPLPQELEVCPLPQHVRAQITQLRPTRAEVGFSDLPAGLTYAFDLVSMQGTIAGVVPAGGGTWQVRIDFYDANNCLTAMLFLTITIPCEVDCPETPESFRWHFGEFSAGLRISRTASLPSDIRTRLQAIGVVRSEIVSSNLPRGLEFEFFADRFQGRVTGEVPSEGGSWSVRVALFDERDCHVADLEVYITSERACPPTERHGWSFGDVEAGTRHTQRTMPSGLINELRAAGITRVTQVSSNLPSGVSLALDIARGVGTLTGLVPERAGSYQVVFGLFDGDHCERYRLTVTLSVLVAAPCPATQQLRWSFGDVEAGTRHTQRTMPSTLAGQLRAAGITRVTQVSSNLPSGVSLALDIGRGVGTLTGLIPERMGSYQVVFALFDGDQCERYRLTVTLNVQVPDPCRTTQLRWDFGEVRGGTLHLLTAKQLPTDILSQVRAANIVNHTVLRSTLPSGVSLNLDLGRGIANLTGYMPAGDAKYEVVYALFDETKCDRFHLAVSMHVGGAPRPTPGAQLEVHAVYVSSGMAAYLGDRPTTQHLLDNFPALNVPVHVIGETTPQATPFTVERPVGTQAALQFSVRIEAGTSLQAGPVDGRLLMTRPPTTFVPESELRGVAIRIGTHEQWIPLTEEQRRATHFILRPTLSANTRVVAVYGERSGPIIVN